VSGDLRSLLARLPGCARLGADALDALARAARPERFAPGVTLLGEGQPAPDWYCVLESGGVHVSRVDAEGDGVSRHLGAGDVVDPGIPGTPAPCSVRAVEETRCLLVPQSLVSQLRGGRVDLMIGSGEDPALFVRRVRDLVERSPVTCPPATPVAEAARLMSERSVGSVIVADAAGRPQGIVTDRDLRTRVLAAGLDPSTPAARVMSSPLLSVESEHSALDALLEMTRRNIHHLGVVAGGRLVGVLSSHDLLGLQDAHPVRVAREIESAADVDGLARTAWRVESVVRWLASGGAGPIHIGRIVAELNDRLVRRALALIEIDLEAAGHGRAPVAYSWLVAGSEGRREQTLKTDQDNGLVYRDPPAGAEVVTAAYFERLATAMGETLTRLGFPRCPGGFMASNPRWCQPMSAWRRYFGSWMETPQPEPLLRASLFFDLRPIAGEEEVGRSLWEWVCETAPTQTLFLRHMAHAALDRQVPLGLFGGFVVERSGVHKDRLDLKARGVFPMAQAMRVYALSLGIRPTNTIDRLRAAGEQGIFTEAEVAELSDAYQVIARLRLSHQLACLDAGATPDNFIRPRTLGKTDRLLLKEAFRSVAWLQRGIEERFQTALVVA
jgi:CBS domain-containing protein